MGLIIDIVDIVGICLEVILLVSFFVMFGKHKYDKKHNLLLYLLYIIVSSTICIFIKEEIVWFVRMILGAILLSFLFEIKFNKRIFLSVLFVILLTLSEIVVGLAIRAYSKMPIDDIQNNPLYYTVGVVSSKIIMLTLIKASKHYIVPRAVQIPKPAILVFLLLPIATFFIVCTISDYYGAHLNPNAMWVAIISILALIGANIALIFLFEWQMKQSEENIKEQLAKQQMEHQVEYYKSLLDSSEEFNTLAHNIKNEIYGLQDALSRNIDEGKNRVEEMMSFVKKHEEILYTQNNAINALINAKIDSIQKQGIKFNCRALLLEDNAISNMELCIVLGNLLDNAIEGCANIDTEERYIDLDMIQQGNYLSIKIVNPCDASKINKRLSTTKSSKQKHGYGISSVNELVEKHQGTINIEFMQNKFEVIIAMSNPIMPNTQK